jgi:DNA (cytosine-5)-methyltransferase 1
MLAMLSVAGLFAGVGGLELGLARAKHECVLLCEIDPGASAVLEDRFPKIKKHRDICTLRALPKDVELIAAGFPCQDLSQAGRTVGIEGARSGLVGEVFRLLEKRRTPWVLLENVPFMLQLARGRALAVIVEHIEQLGYKWAYRVVNSRAFGLPQRRERVYFLASRTHDPRDVLFVDEATPPAAPSDLSTIACGFYWTEGIRGLGWAVDAVPTLKGGSSVGIPSPPAIVLPGGRIVKPDLRDAERMQGFTADWTCPAVQVTKNGARWKLVGNAVTVDVAAWLGERLADPGNYLDAPRPHTPLEKDAPWPTAAFNTGGGRYSVAIGTHPRLRKSKPLAEFLEFPVEDLSERATRGFYERTKVAKLRFPAGFIDAVRAHLARMETRAA